MKKVKQHKLSRQCLQQQKNTNYRRGPDRPNEKKFQTN